jgi:hypothetical protein
VLEPVDIYDKGPTQEVIVDPDLGEKFEANFTCRARVDELILDSLELSWWRDNARLYSGHPYTIISTEEQIFINLTGISDEDLGNYLGEYTCRASATGTTAHAYYKFDIKGYTPPAPVQATVADFWWVFLIVILLLLILLLVICCVLYMQRNKGDDYPVDYYERENGNDPDEECKDAGFKEHQRPIDFGTIDRKASMGSSMNLDDNESKASSAYGYDNDAGKFSEEGSFIGQYNTYNRPTIAVPSHAVSHA